MPSSPDNCSQDWAQTDYHKRMAAIRAKQQKPVVTPPASPIHEWLAQKGGVKFDGDKPRMDLIDRAAMEELGYVLGFGAKKYAANNWRKGINYSRLVGAALRHIHAFNDGEDKDPESGYSHIGHAMCCLMFLMGTIKHNPDMDDRWITDNKDNT
jgi:hypothetical protein